MKVFVLYAASSIEFVPDIVGIFTTKDLAEDFLSNRDNFSTRPNLDWQYEIEEFELDKIQP